jgi:hypothetical protein
VPWPSDDPETYFTQRRFGLRLYEDAKEGDWSADLTSADRERTLQRRYGSGVSADAAALRAQRRYHVEQEPDPPLPRRLP